jgi:hypothetical protein
MQANNTTAFVNPNFLLRSLHHVTGLALGHQYPAHTFAQSSLASILAVHQPRLCILLSCRSAVVCFVCRLSWPLHRLARASRLAIHHRSLGRASVGIRHPISGTWTLQVHGLEQHLECESNWLADVPRLPTPGGAVASNMASFDDDLFVTVHPPANK